jgi:hypothetical protein
MQNLHQSTMEHKILYSDKSSEEEQLLIRSFLRKKEKYEHTGCMKFKINTLPVTLKLGTMKDSAHTYK